MSGEAAEERPGVADRERRHLIDRLAPDAHVARLAPQPRAAAVRARQVAAIAAEKHADVDLVLLALEPAEEAADAVVVVAAVDDEPPFRLGQL